VLLTLIVSSLFTQSMSQHFEDVPATSAHFTRHWRAARRRLQRTQRTAIALTQVTPEKYASKKV